MGIFLIVVFAILTFADMSCSPTQSNPDPVYNNWRYEGEPMCYAPDDWRLGPEDNGTRILTEEQEAHRNAYYYGLAMR